MGIHFTDTDADESVRLVEAFLALGHGYKPATVLVAVTTVTSLMVIIEATLRELPPEGLVKETQEAIGELVKTEWSERDIIKKWADASEPMRPLEDREDDH